jgi:uncharacterized protein HemX
MESDKINALLQKYFEGETTIAEENELKKYFSSAVVAPHLQQYQPLFGYYTSETKQNFEPKLVLQSNKNRKMSWLAVAASLGVLLGVGIYTFNNVSNDKTNKELGTYNDPEEAFRETQKALAMLSNHVNVGIESIQYIENYENTKDQIFITE